MKKGFALIVMLVAVLMLTGCNLVGYDEALDGAQVVAKVNDTEITKSEWLAYREYMANYYSDYYANYLGINMPVTDEVLASYSESALENLIQNNVLQDKIAELGYDQLSDEEMAEIEEGVDSTLEFYRLLIRMQNYSDIETVEEEYDRLYAEALAAQQEAAAAEATPSEPTADEATPSEPVAEEEPEIEIDPSLLVATVTNAELEAMIDEDLAAFGYSRENLISSETVTRQNAKLREYAVKDVTVSDEEIKAEFDSRVASQQTSYDATPTLYASAVNNGSDVYYVPAGYRGVKNLLVSISDEAKTQISELTSTLTTAQNTITSVQSQLEALTAEDTSSYDEESLAAYNAQIEALNEQAQQAETTVTETQTALDEATEAAFAEILPEVEEALAKAQAGEDFDALIAQYGDDPGMLSEPAATQGYLICDGLTLYVQEFQDAAMALASVGDVSAEPVRTSYGYHILKYEMDIEPGAVEFSDEIAEDISSELLETAQDAAYEAAVTTWVSEADVKTYPKVMK